jgi:hypothetical protein
VTSDRNVTVRFTGCPSGHGIKLVMMDGTPNMIRMVKCPTCGIERMGLIGKLVAVTGGDQNSG